MKILNYTSEHREAWDDFISRSKNGTFILKRGYMEYHANRFNDYSLLFCDGNGNLEAVLPANIRDGVVSSHGGLTYGGIIIDAGVKASRVLSLFHGLMDHLSKEKVSSLIYKPVPSIYHRIPAEEDLYAIFRLQARLFRRDLSSAILLEERPKYSENRRRGIKRAVKSGLSVRESDDFSTFFEVVGRVLAERHNTRPVHTASEMELLAARFPANIRLFAAYKADEMLAGVLMFVSEMVAHVQYMACSEAGKECGALDLVLNHLIMERYSDKRFFNFGISTEENGLYLNEGLINQKEQFGGRGIVHDFYELTID